MNHWKSVLRWLVHLTVWCFALSQDICKPAFGYERFVQLNEDTAVGTVILTLNAPGTPATINLTLAQNVNFGFNASTQEVFVAKELEADTGQSITSFRLSILCVNLTSGSQVTISVTVSLRDVNDNAPIFTKSHYDVNIGETTSVGQQFNSGVSADDRDTSYNNRAVFFYVEEGPYSEYFRFASSPDDAMLELLKGLDFETLPNMTITVIARNDLSDIPLNSTALLTVHVTDEDDLNPVFTSPLYEGVVHESAALNTVVNVTPAIFAYDADISLNVPVVYSFHDQFYLFDREAQGSQKAFAIDNKTAEVRLIGAVQPTKISIVVQATQMDNPSRYGVAMLVITVAGENSNAPKFVMERYMVYVSEALPIGTTILYISATDMDFGSTIHYTILGGSSQFALDTLSGAVNLTKSLDYETSTSHNFTVVASDGVLNSTATVIVNVVDANDNTPSVPDHTITVEAERKTGTVLTTIQPLDGDFGTAFSFQLLNYNSLFSVDNAGVVRIAAESTELAETVYVLYVTVSDNGAPPRETSVWVTVRFPPLVVTQASVMAGATDDTIAIALGVVAAILLVVVVILIVYICRRRYQNSEQLDKAKANRSQDPRGLRFKEAGAKGRGLDRIHFQDDGSDGGTTVQENPLKETGAFNYGFVHHDDGETDRNMDEIHIETAVIPYNNNNNGRGGGGGMEMYQNEDSSDYGDTLPHDKRSPLLNGLYPQTDTSSESLNTSHTHLMNGKGSPFAGAEIGTTSFGKKIVGDGTGVSAISMDGLDPDVSVTPPPDQKSELTVYF